MTDALRGPRRRFLSRAGRLAALGLMAGRLGPVDAAPRRDAFIEGLIQRMTLEEKAGQLSIYFDDAREEAPNVNPAQVAKAFDSVQNDILQGRIGGLFNGLGVASGRRLQRLAVEESRLKIPLIFAADVIHGLRTVFPVPLGEAAAFDPDLAERTARGRGGNQQASPTAIDIVVTTHGDSPWMHKCEFGKTAIVANLPARLKP